MKRLVYSPRVDVFVKTDSGEVINLSPYVTSCNVNRKLDQVSTARVEFRNPKHIWTEGGANGGPVFHPMDPIIITMTRIKDRPIQVFTGYCDTTPYLELFPGVVSIEASCTLKRLLYTYWDPGLPFVWDFLGDYGWQADPMRGNISNVPAESTVLNGSNGLNDGSLGELLFAILRDVGGWDDKIIHIEKLPPKLLETVVNLFEDFKSDLEETQDEWLEFIKKVVGEGAYGGGAGGNSDGDGADGAVNLRGKKNVEKAYNFLVDKGFTKQQAAGAVGSMMQESGKSLSTTATNPSSGAYGIAQWLGGRLSALKSRKNYNTLGVQLAFLWDELQGPEGAAYSAMKQTKTIEEAVFVWTDKFERPGKNEYVLPTRNSYAQAVYKEFA